MKRIFSVVFLLFSISLSGICQTDSLKALEPHSSVLIIPYRPMMHLSDADQDISEGSEMEMPQMRAAFRNGLIKALNKQFAEVYDIRLASNSFVRDDDRDLDALYHSILFESDSIYPLKDPKKFAARDSLGHIIKTKNKKDIKYINSVIYDQGLIPDLSNKYNADYIIFLNEFDIKTNFDDCINLAMKIYRRDIKVHYTVYDRNGKQIYGDVAISHFASNSNDVNEIMKSNFPVISDYVLASLKRAEK